jgi:RNA 2',3'-cyclic 3'-phosphodiesterase
MPRLFVALRPPRSIRCSLCAIMDGVEGVRWQDDDQLHITLRFIGEVDGRVADDIALALSGVRASDFNLAISGLGTFARRGRIDTLWAGITPKQDITALHHKIDHALVRLGLPPEGRAYCPHITLARLNRASGPLDAFIARNAALSSAPFAAGSLILYESTLAPGGAIYAAVARWRLS